MKLNENDAQQTARRPHISRWHIQADQTDVRELYHKVENKSIGFEKIF